MDRPQALTLLLVSFRNLGGFEVLGEILNKFYESALEITQKQGQAASEESQQRLLNLSLGGIKIILAFYAQIINFKVIGESQQTSSMQQRSDRDRERSDYFLTAQFLVELRFAVIKPVEKIWNSDLMDIYQYPQICIGLRRRTRCSSERGQDPKAQQAYHKALESSKRSVHATIKGRGLH
jgi:E3 ubiquitin-protein ligase HUWE1